MVRLTALLLALTVATPAAAGPRHMLTVAAVPIDDLDLRSEAGAAAMLRRLDRAAREICGFTRTPLFPGAEGRAWRCRREAIGAAVERLNAPRLTLAWTSELSAELTANP
jgi:UrcA family protein